MGEVTTRLGLIPLLPCKDTKSGLPRERGAANKNRSVDELDGNTISNSSNALIEITTSPASPFIIIGRTELLDSLRSAYEICDDQSKDKSSYDEALQWGTKHISREMLRFSAEGMQIRAKHGAVLPISSSSSNVNDETTTESASKEISGGIPGDGEWSKDLVKVKPGSTICIGACVGQGVLNFRVVTVNPKERTESRADSIKTKDCMVPPNMEQDKPTSSCVIDLTDSQNTDRDNPGPSQEAVDKRPTSPIKTNSTEQETQSSFVLYFFPFGNGTFIVF